MKRLFKQSREITRGMPSAVALSILVHAALFLLAGMLVVFTVVNKKEQKFEPPKAIERPKMKLKKPKVKIRKTTRPKPTTRIVTKVSRASMPDIQLPEMSGMGGEGFGGGIEGFDMMPDLDQISVFGGGHSIGNDLVGTFYDLKRDRQGRDIPYSRDELRTVVRKFVRKGFKSSEFAKYYRSPKKLYATTIMIPPMVSPMGPIAFGEKDTEGFLFLVHYEGSLVHKDGITFRFWGGSGDILLVGVDNEVVLNACWYGSEESYYSGWHSTSADNRKYMLGFTPSAVGDWITLEPGVPHDLDVLIGENPGGGFSAELLVEVQGVEYERNDRGAPILPIFKTAEPTLDLMDAIYSDLVEGEACLTNGPVFCDYAIPPNAKTNTSDKSLSAAVPLAVVDSVDGKMRVWTLLNEKTFEAEYVITVGDKAVFTDPLKKQRKLPLAQLSAEDRRLIELESPPKFNVSFSKQSSQWPLISMGPYIMTTQPPVLIDYVFTAKLRQISAGAYSHELRVEFFAIGEEVDGDNYILLDRQAGNFSLTKENERAFSLSGDTITMSDCNDYHGDRRGQKYGGYLITVTDSRGIIIDYKTSHKWLFENLEALKQLPVGKHFDKTGARVFPPRPKRYY